MSEVSERDIISSIERGFAVLLAFDADLPEPTLAELAAATGLSRPAVRRILLTLQKLGYVRSRGTRWSLTPRVLTIGQHYTATHTILEVVHPHLLRVTELTGESASLAQLDGTDVVYVARVQVRRVLSLNVDVGTRLPAHATSMGRVLAAYADASVVERIVAAGLPALTDRTITDEIAFRDSLHRVRKLGFAVVDSELEEGFMSAAVPVREPNGDVIGALAYSTSSSRMSADRVATEIVPVLLDAARAVDRDLAVLADRRGRLAPGARDGFF